MGRVITGDLHRNLTKVEEEVTPGRVDTVRGLVVGTWQGTRPTGLLPGAALRVLDKANPPTGRRITHGARAVLTLGARGLEHPPAWTLRLWLRNMLALNCEAMRGKVD